MGVPSGIWVLLRGDLLCVDIVEDRRLPQFTDSIPLA